MSNYDNFTDQDVAELKAMNEEINAAIKRRTTWLDKKISERANVKLGEPLYEIDTGACVGPVVEHSRWHRGDLLDHSFSFYYSYAINGDRCMIGNTSSQSGKTFGTLEEAAKMAEYRAKRMRNLAECSLRFPVQCDTITK